MPNAKKSILQPKNDVVFKALFSRGKPRITQAMLEAILKMKIDKLELDKSTEKMPKKRNKHTESIVVYKILSKYSICFYLSIEDKLF